MLQGARSCIGQNLAILNFTTTLAVILSRFTIHLPVEVSTKYALTQSW